MHRKNRMGKTPRLETRASAAEGDTPEAFLVAEDDANEHRSTLQERLHELIKTEFAGSHTAFGSAVGVGATHVKAWLEGGTSPGAIKLMKISGVTNASVDWLLGYNVPADRNVRTSAGDFAVRLHAELQAAAPPFAPLPHLGDPVKLANRPGWSQLVIQDVVNSWWDHQRALLASSYGDALRRLANTLEEGSGGVADVRVATLMRQQAREHRGLTAVLQSPESTWRDLFPLQPSLLRSAIPGVSGNARYSKHQADEVYLQAPFLALGGEHGFGVAWRKSERNHEAWFIDPVSLKVEHRTKGAFLVGRTIADTWSAT
jgi:transcriptional regulator with XRE-family HTH domain